MLYHVRYEIAISEMMENNMHSLEYQILAEFKKEDPEDYTAIYITQAEEALKRCKMVNLTPFQIHLLLGLSDCNGDGMIYY